MAVPVQDRKPRWLLNLQGSKTLADDLGVVGAWVGPRTGPTKRSHGEKEDYVLRSILVALKMASALEFPVSLYATFDDAGEPDFIFSWPTGRTLGLEVTEAGEEDYQKWLTFWSEQGQTEVATLPFEASSERTASEIRKAIKKKVAAFDSGKYRSPDSCDLVVYDNTAWGGFLDKDSLVRLLGRPNELLGRFRQIHVVFEGIVFLDVFGEAPERVEIKSAYEIDYSNWVREQVERFRKGGPQKLDLGRILEELEDLGKAQKQALRSHLRNLLLHLLKWQYQPALRSKSWQHSINNARAEIDDLLEDSPSLHAVLKDSVAIQFGKAVKFAARETGLEEAKFPSSCPYEIPQLLDQNFLPNDDD